MGNICEKPHPPIEYRSGIKQLSSAISEGQPQPQHDNIQLITLTSQNTQTSFSVEKSTLKNSKTLTQTKTISDFKIVKNLGKGAFGQVYLVKDTHNSKLYAMKIIQKDTIKNHHQKINTLSQRYILQAMDHPFLVKLHYAFQSQTKLFLLVDFMPGGQLFYLLRSRKIFEEQVAKFYAAEILLALQYLHNRNIIYRDLKPENILLSKQGHIKLADFGLSKICFSRNQLAYSICGTPEYIAPEIILGRGYDQSADWFSFGSLLYDMLTGKPPFYSKNKHQILSNITSKEVPIPTDLSTQARSVLQGLFKIKPKQRLGYKNGAQQIKDHDFFKDVNFQQLQSFLIKPPIEFENDINENGFDQNLLNQSIDDDNNISLENVTKDAFFKDFSYFKPDTFSLQNQQLREQAKRQSDMSVKGILNIIENNQKHQ